MERIRNQENKKETLEILKNLENFDFLANQHKIDIICVYKGIKPASKIELLYRPGYPSYIKKDFQSNLSLLKDVLKSLNLSSSMDIDDSDNEETVTTFYIGKNQQNLQEVIEAFSNIEEDRDKIIGKALGYPKTAINNYPNKIKSIDSLPEEVKNSEYIKFLNFRLSEDYWQEEIEEVKKRAATIKEVDENFYNTIINS